MTLFSLGCGRDFLGSDVTGTTIPHLGNETLEAFLIPFECYRGFAIDSQMFEIRWNER